jgi:hypothetical protein
VASIGQAAEPVSPGRLRPGLSRDLETICLKCLEKSPGRRYESARALADDLRRYLDGRPTLARPLSSPERLAKWAKRRPWKAVSAALAAVAAVAAVAVAGASGAGASAPVRAARHGAPPTVASAPLGSYASHNLPVDRYTLSGGGVTARVLTYGGIIQQPGR